MNQHNGYLPCPIMKSAEEKAPWLTEIYREFHRYPETAHHEIETNRRIRRTLDRLEIGYLAPADNITIAVVEGCCPGKTVGIRCDTDALAVTEETGLPYASEIPGAMHACGHDAHITAGLGAAALLKENADSFSGKVKIIFQPAEEGELGADEVIETGLVDDADVFFGLHVWSAFPLGECHVSPGPVSAAVDMFTVKIHGKGGHGATPELCTDPLTAGADLVGSLQYIVSRGLPPTEPAVVTVGSFHAGGVGNIIPGEAELKGTVRTVTPAARDKAEALLQQTAESVAAYHGCTTEVIYTRVHGSVINDEKTAALAKRAAEGLVSAERIGPQVLRMLGDDFSAYGVLAPGCYVQVGITPPGTEAVPHHNGRFVVDEGVLPLCAGWMANCALLYLKKV